MRRLFGVVVFAAVPIACGTVPSAPTVSFPDEAATKQTFAASARVAPPCSDGVAWSSVKGVVLDVAARGRGWVTVRAELVIRDGSRLPSCYTTVFSVEPSVRGLVLEPASKSHEATLSAPDGVYVISVTATGPARPVHTASLKVEIPEQ
jgi:hypothetical protein